MAAVRAACVAAILFGVLSLVLPEVSLATLVMLFGVLFSSMACPLWWLAFLARP